MFFESKIAVTTKMVVQLIVQLVTAVPRFLDHGFET